MPDTQPSTGGARGPVVRAKVRVLALLALVTAAWISAGATPLTGALAGARAPVDFVRDYVVAHARVHLGRGAPPDDEAGNAYAARLGAPLVVLLTGPYHIHPPPALLPILPLTALGFEGAARAWLALSLVALAALAFFVAAAVTRRDEPSPGAAIGIFVLLILWPPVLHNLEKGQWSILLATLIAAGQHALARDRPRAAGAWLGVAASLKATPGLLLIFLAMRHRRAAGAMAATMAGAALLSLAVGGVAPWLAFLEGAPRDVAAWQSWIANTASLNGLFARALTGDAFARPFVDAPTTARALGLVAAATLVALAVSASRRAPRTAADDRRLFAAWTALVVLLNPLAWSHTLVLALTSLALLADAPRPRLTAAAFVLLTIPRETLAALAGPLPVSPARGLVLSLHAAALLLLFGAALSRARTRAAAAAHGSARDNARERSRALWGTATSPSGRSGA